MPTINGTFDGASKLFVCGTGLTVLNVTQLYSAWKEWVRSGAGIGYFPAFEAIGGQSLPGGLFAGQTYFLTNGWKIQPQPISHKLTIVGNLYTDDGAPVTVAVPNATVEVVLNTSAQAQGIQTSGTSIDYNTLAQAIAQATWSHQTRTVTNTLTLQQVESSAVLARKSDVAGLQTYLEPYLNKITTIWTGNGFDISNPISAMAPTLANPGWIKSQDLAINQVHRQHTDGSFSLTSNV